MLDMVRREILPAVVGYTDRLVRSLLRKREAQLPCACEERLSKELSALSDGIDQTAEQLDAAIARARDCAGGEASARCHHDEVLPVMHALRALCDEAELLVAKDVWPYPSYGEMLFSVM